MSALWLVDWFVKSTLVLVICAAACFAFRGQASVRRLIWIVGFGAVALLPLFTLVGSIPPSQIKVEIPAEAGAALSPATVDVAAWVWALGAGIALANYGIGLFALVRIKRRSVSLAIGDIDVRMSTTSTPSVALAWGFFRPVILLPQGADSWPHERRDHIVRHEVAHLRQRDCLFQLLVHLVCSILWFNPAIWLAARAFRREVEAAADDAVLSSGIKASDYAETLLWATEAARGAPAPSLAFVRPGQLERRIKRIVANVPRSVATKRHILMSLSAALLFSCGMSAVEAEISSPASARSKEWWDGYRMGQSWARSKGQYKPPANLARNLFLSTQDKRDLELWLAKRKQ